LLVVAILHLSKNMNNNLPDALLDLNAIPGFVEKLLAELHELGLTAHIVSVDHVCFRVSSEEHYEIELAHLGQKASMISEVMVNDRPIAVFQLHNPIDVDGLCIDVVELPAPKTGKSYKDGFEHIEVVCRLPIQELSNKYPRINFDRTNLAHPTMPELTLRLKNGLVKFHNRALLQIIQDENLCFQSRQPAWAVILDLDDTLVHSKMAFLKAAHRALERKLGHDLKLEDVVAKAASTFDRFFGNFGIITAVDIAATVELFQDEYTKIENEIKLPLGIRNFLSVLYHSGINLHCWTARDEKTAMQTLRRFKLLPYFKQVHAWTPEGPNKPRPSDAIRELTQNNRCIVVGDSDSDISGAISLNVPFIQSIWIHQKKLPLGDYPRASTPRIAVHELFRMFTKEAKNKPA
jgi:predicted metalloenzyme YecM/phosphoglycolate phosphatase-like HAD superfamily hydrolase